MFPLIKHYFLAFFFDENAAKRFLAGIGGLLGTAGVTLLAFGTPTVLAWNRHELIQHAIVTAAGALFAMLPGPKIAPPLEPPK